MNSKYCNDEIDILIFNYFNNKVDEKTFNNFVMEKQLNYDDLVKRFNWLKKMNIDPNVIHLSQNHQLIYEIFDKCNMLFNENNIEYYYTSGILSYLLVNKSLQRYHHDLDIFVNMKDVKKLEEVCSKYGFMFERKLGDRSDGSKRVMLKMYYNGALEIPITIFMYVRKKDGSIEQNDYFIRDNNFFVEKMYNSPIVSDLSFSDVPKYHNNIKYFAITLEALYLSKYGNRPKDIYDCSQFDEFLDLDNLKQLSEEIKRNPKNKVFVASDDEYSEFIFSDFELKEKVLLR